MLRRMATDRDPDLPGQLEAIADELRRARIERGDDPEIAAVAARLEGLVEILIGRGALVPGHRKILSRMRPAGRSVHLSLVVDKRQVRSPDIDCASLIPLCHARCCALRVPLSRQDIDDGLRWDLADPYRMELGDDGYCRYHGDDGCTIYDNRPAACREYDCLGDPRVWLDWERRVPAPMPAGLPWPR